MTLVVVRCTECRGASRVDESALGLTVACPRCDSVFTAIEEAELLAPGPLAASAGAGAGARAVAARNAIAPAPTPPDLDENEDDEDGEDDDADDADDEEGERDEGAEPVEAPRPDAEFDPHRDPPGSLPASVLVGLALLPFLIPILWLIAPAVVGHKPLMTLATPLAVAFSVSALCLAIIYTRDWTPTTRVKGVLVLVVLSYFAGVSLFFVSQQAVAHIKQFFGMNRGIELLKRDGFQVRMPGVPVAAGNLEPLRLAQLKCSQSTVGSDDGRFRFTAGSGPVRPPAKANVKAPVVGSDEWFDLATADIARSGQLVSESKVTHLNVFNGRELHIKLDDGSVRLVQYFVVKTKVYYLAIEGPDLTPDDEDVRAFFKSFLVTGTD